LTNSQMYNSSVRTSSHPFRNWVRTPKGCFCCCSVSNVDIMFPNLSASKDKAIQHRSLQLILHC